MHCQLFLSWLPSELNPGKMSVRVAFYIFNLAHEIGGIIDESIMQVMKKMQFEEIHFIENEMLLQLTQGRCFNAEIRFRPLNVAGVPNKLILQLSVFQKRDRTIGNTDYCLHRTAGRWVGDTTPCHSVICKWHPAFPRDKSHPHPAIFPMPLIPCVYAIGDITPPRYSCAAILLSVALVFLHRLIVFVKFLILNSLLETTQRGGSSPSHRGHCDGGREKSTSFPASARAQAQDVKRLANRGMAVGALWKSHQMR